MWTLTSGWESIGTIRLPRPSVLDQHANHSESTGCYDQGCAATGLCFRRPAELSPVIPAAVTHVITCHEFTVQRSGLWKFNTCSSTGCQSPEQRLPRQNNPA
jgi:hypothetical protein